MAKHTKIKVPSYVEGFRCIGGSCEDSCCIGWDIDIDKLTFRSYFRTNHEEMKQRFRAHVYKNEVCDSEEVDYGKVKIGENHWCPFLNSEKLCDIYINLGEEYLSNVCTSYPRVLNIVDNHHEMSLFMSCPEAVRMLLADDEPIIWKEISIPLQKHIIHSYVDTSDREWTKSPIRQLKQLRERSISIMSDRSSLVTERLRSLGHELERQFNKNRRHNETSKTDSLLFSFGILKEMLTEIGHEDAVDSPYFLEMVARVKKAYYLDEAIAGKEQANHYGRCVAMKAQWLESVEPVFEKYLVNFMYQANFPFTENQTVFDGYVMLVMRYALLKFLLIGQCTGTEAMSREALVRCIQVFTKTIEHHHSFMSSLLQQLKMNEFDNMGDLQHFLT